MKGWAWICKNFYLRDKLLDPFAAAVAKAAEYEPTFLNRRRTVISKESVSFTSDLSSCFIEQKSTWIFIRINICTEQTENNSPLIVGCLVPITVLRQLHTFK